MAKMPAKTKKALLASIEKWERNAVAETLDEYKTGPSDCPLCLMFGSTRPRSIYPHCSGCPVFKSTGQNGCFGTPYVEAEDAADDWLDGFDGAAARARAAAREEVAFLKSLLPEEA